MDPVALHLGRIEIRWYGVFVALGFLAAYRLALWRADRYQVNKDRVGDLLFAGMIGGLGGARLLYVIEFWGVEFSAGRWLDALKIYRGGLVFYGGFIGGALVALLFCRWRKLSIRNVADVLAPCIPLGHAFGRIGCLLNGCCFGRPHEGLCSITYPGTVGGLLNNVLVTQRHQGIVAPHAEVCQAVFPIQLVSVALNLSIVALLLCVSSRRSLRGRLFPLYLMLFATGRFLVEFGRGDYLVKTAGMTPAQWICLALLPLGVIWFFMAGRTPKKTCAKESKERAKG
ncbi:MAG: prolipoprotein diacylglyceryl transferase [Lentisphaeria bacterium]|nr:prolipoprotein diacylglyceryl transferase [Lentisphaeria bacterium]